MPVSIAGTNGLLIWGAILPDAITVFGFQPCSDVHAAKRGLLAVEERVRTVRMVLGG
jgi:hypothetical protein